MLYLLSFLMPVLSLASLFSESTLLILLPVISTFIITPSIDLIPIKLERKGKKLTFNIVLYAACLLYLTIFSIFLYKLPSMSGSEIILKSLMMGLSGVVFGINCAHELGHRSNKWAILASKTLLLTTSYMHFHIEHNRGHHKYVATPEDPSTSRYNEIIFTFLIRSLFMSWISAFNIEKSNNGILKNKTLHYALYQFAFMLILGLIHKNLLIGFILHSFVSIILFESVNYIEHYGIVRKVVNGRYEKVTPNHSWNSDHFFSRIHLFEVSRHSDHHATVSKPFYELESIKSSPQMPTGYAGMILLAYVPPLWFKVMNPRVAAREVPQ
jgi:alkane 1-monooxygenase